MDRNTSARKKQKGAECGGEFKKKTPMPAFSQPKVLDFFGVSGGGAVKNLSNKQN